LKQTLRLAIKKPCRRQGEYTKTSCTGHVMSIYIPILPISLYRIKDYRNTNTKAF